MFCEKKIISPFLTLKKPFFASKNSFFPLSFLQKKLPTPFSATLSSWFLPKTTFFRHFCVFNGRKKIEDSSLNDHQCWILLNTTEKPLYLWIMNKLENSWPPFFWRKWLFTPFIFLQKSVFLLRKRLRPFFYSPKKSFPSCQQIRPGFPINFVPSLNPLGEQHFSSGRSARFLWKCSPACNREYSGWSRPGGRIKLSRKNREIGKK